jgi:hypothetical protein
MRRKVAFGAVTFDKRVVCSFMFNNLSELKSGKECDGFITLVNGADFRRDNRCFVSFILKHFWISSLKEDMIDLLNDCFGCHPKVLGASSVEQCCILE